MRILSIAVVSAALCACASSGASMMYKPSHWRGPDWDIAGKAAPAAGGEAVTIAINGKAVAEGEVTAKDPQRKLTGQYEGYDVAAICRLMTTDKVGCAVSIGDEAAGKLVLSGG